MDDDFGMMMIIEWYMALKDGKDECTYIDLIK